jgi:hypothetical protein
MRLKHRVLGTAPALFAAMGCAQGQATPDASGDPTVDASSCAPFCDQDGDGVPDASDQCPDTPVGEPVNQAGCADSQLTATLEPTFPPFGLTWTPTGDLGRAGGLTWTYTGIQRRDLFHIYWIVCDDPATPCGLSLDGAIDLVTEHWQWSAADSNLPGGRLVFTNQTRIVLADASTRSLTGRLTVTIAESSSAAIPFAEVAALGVSARAATHGAEITGTGFVVEALAEVRDTITSTWTPYMDYYDAAPTPTTGGNAHTSFGGSFYAR